MPRADEPAGGDGHEHAEDECRAGADGDERIHVRAVVPERRPRAGVEVPAGPPDHGQREQQQTSAGLPRDPWTRFGPAPAVRAHREHQRIAAACRALHERQLTTIATPRPPGSRATSGGARPLSARVGVLGANSSANVRTAAAPHRSRYRESRPPAARVMVARIERHGGSAGHEVDVGRATPGVRSQRSLDPAAAGGAGHS